MAGQRGVAVQCLPDVVRCHPQAGRPRDLLLHGREQAPPECPADKPRGTPRSFRSAPAWAARHWRTPHSPLPPAPPPVATPGCPSRAPPTPADRATGGSAPRSRRSRPGAQDPPYRRLADAVTEPAQLAAHSAITPARVLPRQPPYQVTDLLAGSRTTWPTRIGPSARDQAAMPEAACPVRRADGTKAASSCRASAARRARQPSPASAVRPDAGPPRPHDGAP